MQSTPSSNGCAQRDWSPNDRPESHDGATAEVLTELPWLAGNVLHDAHTAALMREHGVRRIYTHDADFHRFPFIEVVDPLTQADAR